MFVTAPLTIKPTNSDELSPNSDNTDGDKDEKSSKNTNAVAENASGGEDSDRSWWFNKDDGTFKGTNKNGPAFGFDQSLRLVEKAWEEQGPFHGLLGFSQGACFVGLLCNLSMRGSKSDQKNIYKGHVYLKKSR